MDSKLVLIVESKTHTNVFNRQKSSYNSHLTLHYFKKRYHKNKNICKAFMVYAIALYAFTYM